MESLIQPEPKKYLAFVVTPVPFLVYKFNKQFFRCWVQFYY